MLSAASILSTRLAPGQIALWYLGQEGFLVKASETYLLFDPFLSDSVDRENPIFQRRYLPPIAPQELDFVDYVFCSHDHGDHTDAETLSALAKHNHKAKFILSEAFADKLPGYGVPSDRVLPVRADLALRLEDGISVLPVPAGHEQRRLDASGNDFDLGFVVTMREAVLYHAGDCCIYDGLAERLPKLDIALLPINGRDYFRTSADIIGNMDYREAVLLAEKIGVELLVPMHYDLYPINDVNPAYFLDFLYTRTPRQRTHFFVPGERYFYAR